MALVPSSSSSSTSSLPTTAHHDLIGHATNLLDRLRWINVGNDVAPPFWKEILKKNEPPLHASISNMVWWWPGVVYDGGLSELLQDIDPRATRLRAQLTLQQNRQRASSGKKKKSTAIALLLGFDFPIFRSVKSAAVDKENNPIGDLTQDGAAEYFFVNGRPPLPSSSMPSCSFYTYHDAICEQYSHKVSHPVMEGQFQKSVNIAMTLVERSLQREEKNSSATQPCFVFLDRNEEEDEEEEENGNQTSRIVSPSNVARTVTATDEAVHPPTTSQRKRAPETEPSEEDTEESKREEPITDFGGDNGEAHSRRMGKDRPEDPIQQQKKRRKKVSKQQETIEEKGQAGAQHPLTPQDDDDNGNEVRTADTPIRKDDEFIIVWEKLRYRGWYWKPGRGTYSYFYFRPHAAEREFSSLRMYEDYFPTQEDLMRYISVEYGWARPGDQPPPQPPQPQGSSGNRRLSRERKATADTTKRRADGEEDAGAIKRQKRKEKPPTPSNAAKQEDSAHDEEAKAEENEGEAIAETQSGSELSSPTSSLSSEDSDSSEGSEFWSTWPLVWKRLKTLGWKPKKPSGLDSWKYLKPHCPMDLEGMIEDYDYFKSAEAVLDYIKQTRVKAKTAQDPKKFQDFLTLEDRMCNALDADAATDSGLRAELDAISRGESSPRKAAEPETLEPATPPTKATSRSKRKSGSSKVASPSSVQQRLAAERDRRQRQEKWWQREPMPTFKEVWPVLARLGFSKDEEGHRVPGETFAFPTEDSLRRYICRTGIPRVEGKILDFDDRTLLARWVSTAHLPRDKKLLAKSNELTSEQAWELLEKLGYSELDGRLYAPGARHLSHGKLTKNKDYFQEVEALRFFIRCHGLGRGEKDADATTPTPSEMMQLILWASQIHVSLFRHSDDDASLTLVSRRPKRQSARMCMSRMSPQADQGPAPHEYHDFKEFRERELVQTGAESLVCTPPRANAEKVSSPPGSPEAGVPAAERLRSLDGHQGIVEVDSVGEGSAQLDFSDVAVLTQPGAS